MGRNFLYKTCDGFVAPGAHDATARWLQREVKETGLVRVIFGQCFPEYDNINSLKALLLLRFQTKVFYVKKYI